MTSLKLGLIAVVSCTLLNACIESQIPLACTENDECFTDLGYVCDVVTQICLRGCADAEDCLRTQECDTSHTDADRWVCRTVASDGAGGQGGTAGQGGAAGDGGNSGQGGVGG